MKRRVTIATWVVLASAASLYTILYVWQPATTPAVGGGDFAHYMTSSRALLAGDSPYTAASWDYPPLISFLLAPLAALPQRTAWWCWFALSHVCIGWAAWWTWRALGGGRRALLVVAATWLLGHAIAVSLIEGQLNALLLALLCVVLWPPARSPWWARPAAIAAAFALKVWPGILWAEDLLRRRWRPLLAGAALGAALLAVPWAIVAACFAGPARPQHSGYWLGTPAFLNASLPAVALRLRDPPQRGADLPRNWLEGNQTMRLHLSAADRAVSVAVSLGALVTGFLLLAPHLGRQSPSERWQPKPWQPGAALICLALIAAPISWPHYPVLQLPGTAALAEHLAARRRWARLATLAICFLGVNWTEAIVVGPYLSAYGIRTVVPAATWAITALPAVCGVGLFVHQLAALRERA